MRKRVLCEVEAKLFLFHTIKDYDYLVSEVKCIEKDKNWVKDKKTNHLYSPSLITLSFSRVKGGPLQSVFHSTYQPTNKHNPNLSLSLSLPSYSYFKQTPQTIIIIIIYHSHPMKPSLCPSKPSFTLYSFLIDLYHEPLHKTRNSRASHFIELSHHIITTWFCGKWGNLIWWEKTKSTTTLRAS